MSLGSLYLVRLDVESTLGNIVTMADEATSCVIPVSAPGIQPPPQKSPRILFPCHGKESNKHIPGNLPVGPTED